MAIEVIPDFNDKASPILWAYIYNTDGDLADPTSVSITIKDPDKTVKVDEAAMTKSETGVYYYQYHLGETTDPMDTGNWSYEIIVVDGSGGSAIISTGNGGFKVY